MTDTNSLDLETRGNLAGFLTIIMWSASGLLLAMTKGIPAFELALLTLPAPFIVNMVKWWITKEDWRAHFRHPWYVYVIGTLGIGGYTILWYMGFKFAPPFQANLLNYMWPFLILVFSTILYRQKMTFSQIAGTMMAFIGLLFLFGESPEGLGFILSAAPGYAAALGGAVVWALYSVLIKKIPGFDNNVIAICCLISGLPILIAHLTFETFVAPQGLMWVGLLGLIATRVSYLFWSFAMRYGKVDVVVGISYFTPVFSSILLIVFAYAAHVGVSAVWILAGSCALSWGYITKIINANFKENPA